MKSTAERTQAKIGATAHPKNSDDDGTTQGNVMNQKPTPKRLANNKESSTTMTALRRKT